MNDSIVSATRKYLLQNPNIFSCLSKGLINYSALAREICKGIGNKHFDAVVAACRRIKSKSGRQYDKEKAITKLIKKARLRTKNKISVVIVDKPRDFEVLFGLQRRIRKDRGTFQFIEGEEAVTIILESNDLEQIRAAFAGKIKKITNGLTQILMVFDSQIETTPGVISYIYALLGANAINVVEEMSCWTDVMFVVAEKDAALVADLLG